MKSLLTTLQRRGAGEAATEYAAKEMRNVSVEKDEIRQRTVCIGVGEHWLPKREGTHRKVGRIFRADTAVRVIMARVVSAC